MQFKYPEIRWALLLLLIPIFIHLFQLRRYKKTPFTNVKFLKKVVSESRRSNTLKKWLLLGTRLLLIAATVLAFAQPFFAKKSATSKKETVIYLDDSFSMQAKTEKGTLLSDAVQDLIEAIPNENTFSLFTNNTLFKNVNLKDIQNDLLRLEHSSKQLNLNEIYLKANTLFKNDPASIKNLVVVSDFQQHMAGSIEADTTTNVQKNLIALGRNAIQNISIDSIYVSSEDSENIELTAELLANFEIESTPVSLLNADKLIAKTSASFDQNKKAKVAFTLSANEAIKGKVSISDSGLPYDNQLFFNIDAKEKINVMAIGSANSRFLSKIYTADEFNFTSISLKNLNYGSIANQNLVILNALDKIPNALQSSLTSFKKEGGSILVIPAVDIEQASHNALLSNHIATQFNGSTKQELNITGISFSHPLFKNVFEKSVTNFQYPKVNQYYQVKTTAPAILSYQNGAPFLLGRSNFYVFTAAISEDNSNFKYSPLIVPTLYNMGIKSLQLPELYQLLGSDKSVDISLKLSKDTILKMAKEGSEFIPQQRFFANKVTLNFNENPIEDGIYGVMNADERLSNISFNYSKKESQLVYADLNTLEADVKNESIATLFEKFQNDSTVNELWKWFVTLALLFMVIEVLIQKYLK